MRISVLAALIVGSALVWGEKIEKKQEDGSLIGCAMENDAIGCLRSRLAKDIDEIEVQVTGKNSDVPMSAVMEQAGSFVAEVVDDFVNPEEVEEVDEDVQQEEGRGKKLKRKKKHLQKLLSLAMLFKAKLGLLLQLISTHFQLKFFFIAILSLIINATKLWLDLKKSPSKVIYYEHAQHQHHYENDDHEHNYWGRSTNESPQDLAYSAYAAKN